MIKVILVGVGRRGWWAVDIVDQDPRFEVVGIVDTNEEFIAAAQQALRLTSEATFGSLDAAISAVPCDAIIACTPTSTHAMLARIAFGAGKHFLVEKGMTMSWEEAKALVAEADAAKSKFCVAQNYRYNAVESAISTILTSPEHEHSPGQLGIVDLNSHRYRPEPRTLNYPYAMVWDMSCHHMDSLSAWLGDVSRVTAVSSNPSWSAYEYDADIAAIIQFKSGVVCHYVLTHAATIALDRLLIQGEKGALRTGDVQGLQFYPRPATHLGSSSPVQCDIPALASSEQRVIDAFHDYIALDVEPGISGRKNLNTLAACEMLVRSAREQSPVAISELGV